MKASGMIFCLALALPAMAAGLNDNPGPSDGRAFERADEAERERDMAADKLDREAEARVRAAEEAWLRSRHRTDREEERQALDRAVRERRALRYGEEGMPSGQHNNLLGAPGGFPSRHTRDGMPMREQPEPPYPPMR